MYLASYRFLLFSSNQYFMSDNKNLSKYQIQFLNYDFIYQEQKKTFQTSLTLGLNYHFPLC